MTATLQKIQIQIFKLSPEVQIPTYASNGSAGFDIRAFWEDGADEIIIKAGDRAKISTGIKLIIPEGYELQIRPRSGLAFKNGISLTNTPGTIDSDYRGELQILMINHGAEDFVVRKQDRIAQGIVAPVYLADFAEIAEMPSEIDNARGAGGFGSTGVG